MPDESRCRRPHKPGPQCSAAKQSRPARSLPERRCRARRGSPKLIGFPFEARRGKHSVIKSSLLTFVLLAVQLLAELVPATGAPWAQVEGQQSESVAGVERRVSRHKRAGTARLDRLWDDAVIPYEIDPIFSDERATLFRSAMHHWENHTCIKFVERIPEEHRNYIVFTERSCGCCSFVGKRGNGAQAISIGRHCDKFGIVVHELGHVVGFWHEHTRPDRDQHVQIISKNIMAGQEYNFNKLTKDEVNSLGLAYDYDSILHYATNTFAKDTYLDTILPLHGPLNTEEVSQGQPVATWSGSSGGSAAVGGSETEATGGAVHNTGQTSVTESTKDSDVLQTNSSAGGASVRASTAPNGRQQQASVNRLMPHTSQTGNSTMLNDQAIVQIRRRIESDFQSMLQYDGRTSRADAPTRQTRSLAQQEGLMILDGAPLLVDLSGEQVGSKRARRSAAAGNAASPVDFDDQQHMLSTDNLLAKTRPEIGQRVRLSVGDIAQTNLLYKCPKCGRTIQQLSGIFHSANYYYQQPSGSVVGPQNEFCEWRLTVGLGERIMIDIVDLDIARPATEAGRPLEPNLEPAGRLGMPRGSLAALEVHDAVRKYQTGAPSSSDSDPLIMDDCMGDYLEIRDGYTYRAPVIARLCGRYNEIKDQLRPIVSTSNRLLVSQRSSANSANRRGFLAQHESICGGIVVLGGLGGPESAFGSMSSNDQQKAHSSSHSSKLENGPSSTPAKLAQFVQASTSKPSTSSASLARLSFANGQQVPATENEVLLSSQTSSAARYQQHQSQQALLAASGQHSRQDQGQTGELASTPASSSPHTSSTSGPPASSNGSQPGGSSSGGGLSGGGLNGGSPNGGPTTRPDVKTFSWNMWPIINTTEIQSPNWPENYRPSRECLWHIQAAENHQISLRFDAFDLESHDSCAYDYVEIRDGESLSSEVIGRYCGNRAPEQVLSSGRNMLVKFVSDSDVNKAGFLASLHLEIDECKLGTHGCSYKCSNAVAPYKCECPNGLELAPDGRNCIPTCGGIRNDSSGQIMSPSFPDLYPISTRCVWEIHAPANHRIMLNFSHFDLEGVKAQECDYDFVEIWSKIEDAKYIRNGIYCGPNQAFSVTSIGNFMRIEFNSDNSIQKSGFEANYFIDRDECASNNGGCQHICTNNIGSYQCSCNNGFVLHENKHDCVGSHCLHMINTPEGTFSSPNFPNLYQPNKECAWIFSTAPGHRIKLVFDQFDLESHQECAYDHVAVFDGETMEDHLLGRFCGSRRPLTLVSSYNLLYLLFRSDATNEKRGFNATHSTICGGRLAANVNQNGLILSHPSFDGSTHYNRNEDCEWIIEAAENQRIRIEFSFFSLETDANCNYDQTVVYDGFDESATQLARLCGNDIPKGQLKYTSSGESMLIVFKSDDSINSKGFSLVYTAFEVNEEETIAITIPQQQQQQQQLAQQIQPQIQQQQTDTKRAQST